MSRSLTFAILVAAWLGAGTPAPAASFGVRDEAALFSADSRRQADEHIQTLHRRARQDLLIDTVPAVPDDKAGLLESNRTQFFAHWAQERADAAGVNGVYILICADPRHVQVHVTPDARAAFSDRDREQLRKSLSRKLRSRAYDDALLDSVEFVRDRLDPQHASWWWVLWVVLGIVGIWLLVGLVRTLLGPSANHTPGAGPSGGILAGMFGATAGSWMVHTFLRRGGVDAKAPVPPAGLTGPPDDRIRA
jgi:uncharacterized membrane protein YgcG